jgi:ribokinase
MAKVWVVGSANMDAVFRVTSFPAPGETVTGATLAHFPGGKGANQAVAAARLGADVVFVGAVGKDPSGDALLHALRSAGVDTSPCLRASVPTGAAAILVDDRGENMIVVASGANMEVSPSQVVDAVPLGAGVVLCQLETPLEATLTAKERGRVVLNPAPACPLPSGALAGLWAVTPNQVEAAALSGRDGPPGDQAKALLDQGVENVVVTLGARGCYWTDGVSELQVPGIAVKAVDTTAAGDCFNGALARFLAEGETFPEALPKANLAAAISVTRPGALGSLPDWEELVEFASEHGVYL